jgi:hypothetical protein
MKVLVIGINQWGTIKIYIASRLSENQRPTPFSTRDIEGNEIRSRMNGSTFKSKEIELQKGDYIMLLTDEDLKRDGDMACGHNHYYDGEKLISVYTKRELKKEIPKLDEHPWYTNFFKFIN